MSKNKIQKREESPYPKFKDTEKPQQVEFESPEDYKKFLESFGCKSLDVSLMLMNQIVKAHPDKLEQKAQDYSNNAALLSGIKPKNELEGMLAVQMVTTHNLAMEFLKRATLEGQTVDGVNFNVNRATKLMRLFNNQIETLKRYRSDGSQKMIVEHVSVNKGGQAIVGSIQQR